MKNPLQKQFIKLDRIDIKKLARLQRKTNQLYKNRKGLLDRKLERQWDIIEKQAVDILKSYKFPCCYQWINELIDYDFEGLIKFIEMNLPYNRKLDNDQKDYKEYLRLKKKFK